MDDVVYQQLIRGAGKYFINDHAMSAEDVVHDVIVKCWPYIQNKPDLEQRNYLFKAIFHRVIDINRRYALRSFHTNVDYLEELPSPINEYDQVLNVLQLDDLFKRFSSYSGFHEFILHELGYLSSEIKDILMLGNLTTIGVKTRKHRFKTRVQEELAHERLSALRQHFYDAG